MIYGPPGTGKTYLCAALMEFFADKFSNIRYHNERKLLQKVRDCISGGVIGDYLKYARTLIDDDLVMIDDFGSSGHTTWREEVLMELIDCLYENQTPTIITSNLNPREIETEYGSRIASRLFAKENTCLGMEMEINHREEGR